MHQDDNSVIEEYNKKVADFKAKRRAHKEHPKDTQSQSTLSEIIRWEFNHELWASLVTVLIFGIFYIIMMRTEWVDHNLAGSQTLMLNAGTYEEASAYCLTHKKHLPENKQRFIKADPVMDDFQKKLGYWLQGRQVYYPLEHNVKPADKRLHWYICVK